MNTATACACVGGLSDTSKMPCPSWGTSPDDCRTGSRLALVPGAICAICYAKRGRYPNPVVRRAQARRLRQLRRALADPQRRRRYLAAFVRLLARRPFFRWFDSGDLDSRAHLDLIADIATATPTTRHWLPTREIHDVLGFLKDHERFPENLTVRISAAMVGEIAPEIPGTVRSSVFHIRPPKRADLYACPAPQRGHQCNHPTNALLNCRACFDKRVGLVGYTAQ
jgi:Gene product 88